MVHGNQLYRKISALIFAAVFSFHFGVLSIPYSFNSLSLNNLWSLENNGVDYELIEFLASIKPEVIPTPTFRLDPVFEDLINTAPRPPLPLFLVQGQAGRVFYPVPQIFSHTGIFMCLRL